MVRSLLIIATTAAFAYAQTRALEATFIMQVPKVVDWAGVTRPYIPKRFFSSGIQMRGMFYVGNTLRLFTGFSFFYLFYETAIRRGKSWTFSFVPIGLGPLIRIKRLIHIEPYIQVEFFNYTPYVRIDHLQRRPYEPPYCVYYNLSGFSPLIMGVDLIVPYRGRRYITVSFQRVFSDSIELENHYFPPSRYVLGIGFHWKWEEIKKNAQ